MNTYAINNKLNGIEVYFSQKPEQSIIEELKANKWRWNRAKKCWYAKQSESSLTLAKEIASVEIEPQATKAKAKATTYHKNVSDYITIEEYEKSLREYYNPERYDRNTPEEREQFITHNMETTYNSDNEYRNISKYIRQAIIWKSLNMNPEKFNCNGDNYQYMAIWDKLPMIDGLKPGKKYAAMWGYDQTQITTATHYGKAFGFDVLITSDFGGCEVLLKRIKDDTFSDGCMYFTVNRFTDEEIQDTNTHASYYGR
jgi:hypothetical protein